MSNPSCNFALATSSKAPFPKLKATIAPFSCFHSSHSCFKIIDHVSAYVLTLFNLNWKSFKSVTVNPHIRAFLAKTLPVICQAINTPPLNLNAVMAEGKVSNKELVKTTWRMPKTLLKRIKQYGLDNDKSATQIAHEAFEEYLNKRKKSNL
jgi:hypothetical protein